MDRLGPVVGRDVAVNGSDRVLLCGGGWYVPCHNWCIMLLLLPSS